jgi:hypothetical protein
MANNSDSSGVPEPRKHTLSTKAATNGDPQAERKRQKKLDNSQKKKSTLTEKQTTTTSDKASSSKSAPAKATTIAAKATATATKRQPAKPAPRRPSVECEDVYDESDHPKSNPPRNPRHILEAADGSDDEAPENPAPEVIVVDDHDEPIDVLMNVEAPEESAEAELSMYYYFYKG